MSLFDQITILYEDDHILAINKPAGIMVHSDGRFEGKTLADWILETRPTMKDVGEPIVLNQEAEIKSEDSDDSSQSSTQNTSIPRPGIVHRIDRDTSGALLLAKNQEAFLSLKHQFKEREIRKEYHCFVYGSLTKDFGTIDIPIGRSRSDFRKWSADPRARGELRDASTYYEVIKKGKEATFIKALPKTGRTHQIRVHFKAIHHPIVSDALYARNQPHILGFERVALHAFSIEWKGLDGELHHIEAPYPADFVEAIRLFEANTA
jgi:RluA family pseudouridine synthase